MKQVKISKPTLSLCGLLVAVLLGSGLFLKSILLPETPKKANIQSEVLGENVTVSVIASPSFSPSLSPKPSLKPAVKTPVKSGVNLSSSANPITSANPSSSPASPPAVLGTASSSPSPNASTNPTPSPPAGGFPSPSPSPLPTQSIVNVEVLGSGFTIEITGDLNVCQVLEKAKEQGKISSLTLDDSYVSNMNSLYVKEMNGLSNNWTFKVNGNSPLGCSLYQVKPGDNIVFKFG